MIKGDATPTGEVDPSNEEDAAAVAVDGTVAIMRSTNLHVTSETTSAPTRT